MADVMRPGLRLSIQLRKCRFVSFRAQRGTSVSRARGTHDDENAE